MYREEEYNCTDALVNLELLNKFNTRVNVEKERQSQIFQERVASNLKHEKEIIPKILEKVKLEEDKPKVSINDSNELLIKGEPNFLVATVLRSKILARPDNKKCLKLLRLKNIHETVVIRNNICNQNLCKTAGTYISWGMIKYSTLRKLIYLKAKAVLRNPDGTKKTIKLTNEAVEDHFNGKYRCIEEVIYAIWSGSEDIAQCIKFLAPIHLQAPIGGYKGKKKLRVVHGGSAGYHGHAFDEVIDKMIH